MLSSLLSGKPKMPSHVISVDLGQRSTKAVSVQKKGAGFELLHYVLLDSPPAEKGRGPDIIAEHLKSVTEALGIKNKPLVLIIGVAESLVKQAEVPMIPVADLRLMLKFNSKAYLQQDLTDFVFDAFVLSQPAKVKTGSD